MDRPNKQECRRLRSAFREGVLIRDKNVCRVCGSGPPLDVHHITPRRGMPNDGYALENGISLCKACHERAELYICALEGAVSLFTIPDEEHPMSVYDPERLYEVIGSSRLQAFEASEKLL